MTHFISQPLVNFYAQRQSLPVAARREGPARALPDPYDIRYPRHLWLRTLRLGVSVWWLPLVFYISQALAMLGIRFLMDDVTLFTNEHAVVRALRLDWVPSLVAQQPAGLIVVMLAM